MVKGGGCGRHCDVRGVVVHSPRVWKRVHGGTERKNYFKNEFKARDGITVERR